MKQSYAEYKVKKLYNKTSTEKPNKSQRKLKLDWCNKCTDSKDQLSTTKKESSNLSHKSRKNPKQLKTWMLKC